MRLRQVSRLHRAVVGTLHDRRETFTMGRMASAKIQAKKLKEKHEKRKKDRKERDMAQAWGASLGKPRSKPVGMPEHETTAPWDLNASDGEDNSDPEVEPVTLVSWSDSYDKSAPGIKSTYASDARRAGTPGLARRRQKPDDRKEYNRKQRELGKEHAWAIAHGTKPAYAKV